MIKTSCRLTNQEIEALLVKSGVPATLQRIAICKYVICESDHPTAEQVFDWAKSNLQKISQATVYNTLGLLTEVGLIRAFRFPHSEKVVYDCNTQDHFHFFDENTGRLVDVDSASVQVNLDLPKNFKVNGFDLVLKGEIKNKI